MYNWNKRKVFVSGGAGVIGTALVEMLIHKGADVLVGDIKTRPTHWPKEIKYREGDLNTLTLREAEEFSPEVFFHLAATFERSDESYSFWEENYHNNILLSHHLITILKEVGSLRKIVFASSYLIYDPSLYLFNTPQKTSVPLKETSRLAPRNLCGMSKLLHEEELHFIKKFHPHLQMINARIFRSYGKNSRDILSRWIGSLLQQEEMTIYRPEGLFDFIYAEDVAEGLLRLAETSFDGIVNLGSGRSRSIHEVLSILKNYFKDARIKYVESDIGYEASQADMRLFHELTRWHAFRPLEETLLDIIDFQKSKLLK